MIQNSRKKINKLYILILFFKFSKKSELRGLIKNFIFRIFEEIKTLSIFKHVQHVAPNYYAIVHRLFYPRK